MHTPIIIGMIEKDIAHFCFQTPYETKYKA